VPTLGVEVDAVAANTQITRKYNRKKKQETKTRNDYYGLINGVCDID